MSIVPLVCNKALADRVFADVSPSLSVIMRRIVSRCGPPEQAVVLAQISAQVSGYLASALTDASPGEVFPPETLIAWQVGIMDEFLREKQRRLA